MTAVVWVSVVLIGGAGSVLRFLVDGAVARRTARAFPLGTLCVNATGSLALGFVTGLAVGPQTTLLAATAAAGSYTTFSTWVLETHRLSEERQVLVATANLVISLIVGVAAAALGQTIGAGA